MPIRKVFLLRRLLIVIGCLAVNPLWLLHAQAPASSPSATPDAGLQPLPQNLAPSPPSAPDAATSPRAPSTARDPSVEPGDPTRNTNNSFWLDNYALNDLFQYLARRAGFQYFHSQYLDSPQFSVTGELFKESDPMDTMRELALQYNLTLFKKGRTIYALTLEQVHSPSFYVTKRYHIKHQQAEYLLQPISNFLGINATPAAATFPGYPKPSAIKSAPDATAGTGTATGTDQSQPRYQPGVPFDEPLSIGDLAYTQDSVFVERSSNSLVIRATQEEQDRIAAEISRLDREENQILIKTYVVEVDDTNGIGGGIDWSTALGLANGQGATFKLQSNNTQFPAASGAAAPSSPPQPGIGTLTDTLGNLTPGKFFTNGLILDVTNLQIVLQALQTKSRLKSNNSPMTVAKSGIPVTIRSVTQQTIFLQTAATANVQATTTPYVFTTGLTIDVIARILDGGLIDMNLNPTLSTQTSTSPAQPGTTTTVPIISTRSTTANVTVRSGQAAVIGGIMQDSATSTQNGIPGISKIPGLGYLFKSKNKSNVRTNLIVIVSPTIIPAASRRTDRVGESEREILEGSSDLPGEPPPIPNGRSGKNVRFLSKSKHD
jgi:hypothetical protein